MLSGTLKKHDSGEHRFSSNVTIAPVVDRKVHFPIYRDAAQLLTAGHRSRQLETAIFHPINLIVL